MPTELIGRPHTHQTCLSSILRKTLETGTAADVWDSGCPCALGQTQKSSQARIPTLGERLCPSGHRGVLSSMITEHPSITWPEQGLWYDSSVVWKNLSPSLILLANECTHGEWEQWLTVVWSGDWVPVELSDKAGCCRICTSAFLFEEVLPLICFDDDGGGPHLGLTKICCLKDRAVASFQGGL